MLTGLSIRDLLLIEALDLQPGAGLTALTGETGAGKSIVLDALGVATGARADAGLVRRGRPQAAVSAVFTLPAVHPVWPLLAGRGLDGEATEDLVLRRSIAADGRSRAYVNDQPVSVAALREIGSLLLEVHGQHDAVGLLDSGAHRGLLDDYAGAGEALRRCRTAWAAWRAAEMRAAELKALAARRIDEAEEATRRLAELDRLDPQSGEEAALAEERGLLGSAEKIVGDIGAARDAFGGRRLSDSMAQALRALERARDKALAAAGGDAANPALETLSEALAAGERTLVEAQETMAALDAAARAFVFEPTRLEKAEERLFALRAAARKLGVTTEDLPAERRRFADRLQGFEAADETAAAADHAALAAEAAYRDSAKALSVMRSEAGGRLAKAVEHELKPLKLDKARFQVAATPGRDGPDGADRIAFEISTNPGAPFGSLGDIASGGELARLALALKVALSTRGGADAHTPTLIFDEVDQGVGGAVAAAVGSRLKRLAAGAQVLVVTHSPQIAARADIHWQVSKASGGGETITAVSPLGPEKREEEIARMLAGAEVTDAARGAARALITSDL